MTIDVFYFPDNTPDLSIGFISSFLKSSDFTNSERLEICRQLKINSSNSAEKDTLSDYIANHCHQSLQDRMTNFAQPIVAELINRSKTYLAAKTGIVRSLPQLEDPTKLIYSRGDSNKWYGPIKLVDDPETTWYIRTREFTLLKTESYEDMEPQKIRYTVRWLCFARVTDNSIALFWRNFTTGGRNGGQLYLDIDTPFSGRFPYWNFVPTYFREIAELCKAKLEDLPLEKMILHNMWDTLRYQSSIKWNDERIRAEHKGVSLNASDTAATIYTSSDDDEDEETSDSDGSELDISGIRYLASTIRRKMQLRLDQKYEFSLPKGDEWYFDEEILRTLIQQYNPKSYRCSIYQVPETGKSILLYRADTYFGKIAEGSSPDKFKHLYLRSIRELSHLQQLTFLLSYL